MQKMLQRIICLILTLLFATSVTSASSVLSKLSLNLNAAGIFPMGGQYTQITGFTDVVKFGLGLGASLRYEVSENFVLDGSYRYTWLPVKDDQKPFAYKHMSPAFVLSMAMLNGSFFLRSDYRIEPYLTLGCGLCPWRFSEDGPTGKTWEAPYNEAQPFSKTSFGLNAGLGLEGMITSHISALVEVKYYYVFVKDVEKFKMQDFTNQHFVGINIGISYRLGKE